MTPPATHSPVPARPPRRRLDVEERRAAILAAASARFADGGYPGTSVADAAADAGVSQALVFHYFGTKPGLYASVVRSSLDALARRQEEAAAAVPDGAPVRDRVRAALHAHLDAVAAHPGAGGPLPRGDEPAEAEQVRAAVRRRDADRLATLLGTSGWPRHAYAVRGFLGLVDAACLRWVERGCPDAERDPLVDAALGALEGALGDWRV